MEWQDWPSIAFGERDRLPAVSGIYVVIDSENFVWYVGKATDLKNRWIGRGHHRYPQLIRSNKKLQHRLYWTLVPPENLDEKERLYIEKFEPELNGRRVKTYLPKEPQVYREIKRLLKVLNKNTFLFPVIRSAVAGEYIDELGARCIVVVANLNDYTTLDKSIRKRYSQRVRNAWAALETFCGLDEGKYKPLLVPVYNFAGYQFEFILIPEVINYLEDALKTQCDYLQAIEIFGVSVKALKNLEFLDNLNLKDTYQIVSSDNRLTITDALYLKYLRSDLKPCPERID